jgi:hypothetical protein
MDMLPSRRLVKLYEHLREVLADFIYVKCDWAMTAFRLDEHIVGRERCRASQQNRAAHVRFGSWLCKNVWREAQISGLRDEP